MTAVLRMFLMIALPFAVLAGCGTSSDGPEIAPVSGVVTLDGKPVTNASVVFESSNGVVAFGNTNGEGVYELNYLDGQKGAEVGSNTVRIETVLDAPPPANYRDPIPAKYNQRSELKADVQPGQNTHDFALQTK